ncbi:hypothetical protein ABID52_000579 [Fictibacillus halophilus]|uniref:Uncharacterized protein n=1 Tax=Fictibacillus halophilus TaxID=1610490 RepID=A0ABV2LEH5_9BACL
MKKDISQAGVLYFMAKTDALYNKGDIKVK